MLAQGMEKSTQGADATEMPCRLLVADDQPHILDALRLLLKPEGYQLEMVRTPALVLESLAHDSYDGLLIDLNYTRDTTSGQEGLDLVSRVREIDAQLPIVVMTAWGNIDLAVEAMRRGAGDFIQKPWRTRGCSAFCGPRWSCIAASGERSGWRRRTAFCARRERRTLSRRRPPCARCWRRWRA